MPVGVVTFAVAASGVIAIEGSDCTQLSKDEIASCVRQTLPDGV
jgi:hypothetical protein